MRDRGRTESERGDDAGGDGFDGALTGMDDEELGLIPVAVDDPTRPATLKDHAFDVAAGSKGAW